MRYNVNAELFTLRGKPVLMRELGIPGEQDREVPATAGDAIVQALINTVEVSGRDAQGRAIPKQIDDHVKWQRFRLAEKLQEAIDKDREVQLDAEDVKLVKEVTGHAYPPEIMGLVWRVFDSPIPVVEVEPDE